MKAYRKIAQLVDARGRCKENQERRMPRVTDGDMDVTESHWAKMAAQHEASADAIVSNILPSGSGWDLGTTLDWDASSPNKLVFYGSYHHMDDGGSYDGWTEHTVTVRPSLAFGFDLKVSGPNRNEIKGYITEMFDETLRQEVN